MATAWMTDLKEQTNDSLDNSRDQKSKFKVSGAWVVFLPKAPGWSLPGLSRSWHTPCVPVCEGSTLAPPSLGRSSSLRPCIPLFLLGHPCKGGCQITCLKSLPYSPWQIPFLLLHSWRKVSRTVTAWLSWNLLCGSG